ncbi:MAG: leucine-rich repeat domain-containing protein, partial [Acutalibacteraceae bacterium]
MKRFISVMLAVCLSLTTVFCITPMLGKVTALTDEELAAKNYPLPENTVVSNIINTFDTTDDCGSNLSTEEGTYYDKASKRIGIAKAWSEQNVAGKRFYLDGIGFMLWYKSEYPSILRIRSETNTIIFEANVPAHPDGAWLTYYYYGKCENFTFKSDMNSDSRSRISADMTYSLSVTVGVSAERIFYFDEFFTIAPPITAADTYDNAEQFFKFSAARMSSMSNVSCDYSDDGSVTLSTLSGTALSSKSINISYNIDAEQAAGAIAAANEGSGYLAMQCDIVSCINSSDEDAYGYLTLTVGGIEKQLQKYMYGSGSSDIYLIKTADLSAEGVDETLAGQLISVKISGSGVNIAKIKLSPITVYHFPDDELIVQAETMSPKIKTSSGETDALLYNDTDGNRTYVYNTNSAVQYISFELPRLDVGEYEVYAVCSATKNTNVKYSIAINNLRQLLNVHFTDGTYSSYKHITNVSIGTIRITKDYSYGESYMKLVPMPKGSQNIYIDYFSFKKTDAQVTAEPASNFEIKPYPEMENYEVKSVLATFDSYICGGDERYYKENQVAGYVGDGNAFNLNSRGTMNKGNFDNNNLFFSSAGAFDGDGIRFWYKGGGATLIFYGNGISATYKLTGCGGDWVTVLYKDAISGGDMSFATTLSLKTTSATEYYVDELHTVQQKQGDITYELNGDGTASVVGYNLRIENVTVADTYEGCPVTTIKSGALAGTLSLRSVILPDSVTTIESGAFEGDVNLKSITVGSGLTTIGENAFLNCKSLGETEL